MRVILMTTVVVALAAVSVAPLRAASIAVSIGIRETQQGGGTSGGPIFSNGGSAGGIEYVNLDGQSLVADGTWQQFTFTPTADTLTAFAGATANSILEGEWGTLEMIRIRNVDGITSPIRIWIDDVANTVSSGTTSEGFEGYGTGTEAIFQEPNFSGSTAANLVAGGTSLVSDSMAFTGSHSNEVNLQFVDATPTRWVRLTTFNTPNLPNPAIRLAETSFAPTFSFYAKAVVVPEPCAAVALVTITLVGVGLVRRREA